MNRELIQIGNRVRVENGPMRKTGIATETLLDHAITARHYQVGRKDALGNTIKLKEPMTYLDYKGTWGWYIYELRTIPKEERSAGGPAEKWYPIGFEKDKNAALAVARKRAREIRWPWKRKEK